MVFFGFSVKPLIFEPSSGVCWGRLSTKDRLRRWGISVGSSQCELCGDGEETMDHLFFACKMTRSFWERILSRCLSVRVKYTLQEVIQRMLLIGLEIPLKMN